MRTQIKSLAVLFTMLSGINAYAQKSTISQGSITYDKTVNELAIVKDIYEGESNGKEFIENYAKNNPESQVFNFKLDFNANTSLYAPVNLTMHKNSIGQLSANNTVFTDYNKQNVISQKKIFNQPFLLKDNLSSIKWKITSETRMIAGYECKRANGITADSVYVVAFFAENIAVNGGPELFHGLPGMILYVALPHDHINWIATAVSPAAVNPETITPPQTGQVTNLKGLEGILSSKLSTFGPIGPVIIKELKF